MDVIKSQSCYEELKKKCQLRIVCLMQSAAAVLVAVDDELYPILVLLRTRMCMLMTKLLFVYGQSAVSSA